MLVRQRILLFQIQQLSFFFIFTRYQMHDDTADHTDNKCDNNYECSSNGSPYRSTRLFSSIGCG